MNARRLAKELTPGQAAARSGLSVSALHFYERQGLIRARRTEGNQRRYDRTTLRRLGLIKAAQGLGISLAEIRQNLSSLPLDRPLTQHQWSKMAEAWRAQLRARLRRLERLDAYLDGCIGCGCLSMERCPLYNPDDQLAEEGVGAVAVESDDQDNR